MCDLDSKRRGETNSEENLFEEIVIEILPKFLKNISLQIQESQ